MQELVLKGWDELFRQKVWLNEKQKFGAVWRISWLGGGGIGKFSWVFWTVYRTPETSLPALSKGDRSEAKTLRSEENVRKSHKGNINKEQQSHWKGQVEDTEDRFGTVPAGTFSWLSPPVRWPLHVNGESKLKWNLAAWIDLAKSPHKFKEKRNSKDQVGSVGRVHPEWKWGKGQARSKLVMKNREREENKCQHAAGGTSRREFERWLIKISGSKEVRCRLKVMRVGCSDWWWDSHWNILRGGCDGSKMKVEEGTACTFPWFLIHPSVFFWCPSGAGTLHLWVLSSKLCPWSIAGSSEHLLAEWMKAAWINR